MNGFHLQGTEVQGVLKEGAWTLETSEKRVKWKDFITLIKKTNPSIWMMGIALFMSLITTAVGLMIPLFTKNLVDHFSLDSLNSTIIILLVVAFLAQAVASGLSIYLLNYVGQHVVAGLRMRLWDKFIALPIRYYDAHRSGKMISRMTNDTAIVKDLITDHLTSFFTGIISMVGAVTILLFIDWQMTLIMLIAAPLTLAILFPLGRQMHKISKGLQDETATFTAHMSQVLSEVRLVKASNAEANEFAQGEEGIQKLFQFGKREGKVQAFISPLVSLVMMALLVVIIGYGGMRVASGVLSAGDLVAFILYMFQIIVPMAQFTTFFTQLQKAKGATERIIHTLDEPEEDIHAGKDVGNVQQSIRFEHLSFSYDEDTPVLKNVSFQADPGKVTAIVGPSGGGKTTLFSLLERFYAPTDGGIYLGSEQIDEFSLHSWRKEIGYVSQESPLIAGTIRDNITYGLTEKVSEAAIGNALEMAYADEFVAEFPDKLDTEVGERGVKLSGGQRQRIGIARALLRDPNILMLDEATSSLDSKSEIAVQHALDNLMKGRTTFVIAHRLSTVIDADKIIFIEEGQITGNGTHDTLFETHDLYREFAAEQLRMKDIQ